jgi:hypothetical protein
LKAASPGWHRLKERPKENMMRDLYPPDTLERALVRHLAPVKAPETLGVEFPKAGRAGAQSRRRAIAWNPGNKMIFSPALVLLVLTVAAGAVWKSDQPRPLNADTPAKFSTGLSVLRANPAGTGSTGISAGTISANNGATANQFDDACMMCHTGATLYVSPAVQ